MKYSTLAISDPQKLVFGTTPRPVRSQRGLTIGNGKVYPELNFTLPPMHIIDATLDEIRAHYRQIVDDASHRAVELHSEGAFFEFETLPEMTMRPAVAVELIKIMNEVLEEYHAKHGFKGEIRITPNDTREFDRPPRMRTGNHLDAILEVFEKGGRAGGDFFSIESTGAKEVHDDALMTGNIRAAVFALTVLATRDMNFLWEKIAGVAKKTGKRAGGDTACGFANTAMVLAEKGFISKVFAAIDRILTVVRTLPAYEQGAVGPDKDCGYEGPFIKAITGIPISMEGKTAACAHLSPVGNIAAACCDLWSNESVQNVKLLAAMAPTVYMEQLEYDVRLMNQAILQGQTLPFQRLLVLSDAQYDPQALILSPENVVRISEEIVKGRTYLQSGLFGALEGLRIIEDAYASGSLVPDEKEPAWIESIRSELESIPMDEGKFIDEMLPELDVTKVNVKEYGL